VLDFLTEALDAWYAAKRAGQDVPIHDISIEAFSGASAGGMCAAISAVLLQNDFQHISVISIQFDPALVEAVCRVGLSCVGVAEDGRPKEGAARGLAARLQDHRENISKPFTAACSFKRAEC